MLLRGLPDSVNDDSLLSPFPVRIEDPAALVPSEKAPSREVGVRSLIRHHDDLEPSLTPSSQQPFC
jgi:hypothetical protein